MRLQEAVALFLEDAEARNLSPRTLKYYRDALKKAVEYFGDIPVDQLDAAAVRQYMAACHKDGLKPTGVHGRMRVVRAFLNFLEREDILETSPMRKVRLPKVPLPDVPVYSPSEFRALMRAALLSNKPLRDQAILALLYDTGLRASELLGLRLSDIQGSLVRVRGKGDKVRYVPISRQTGRLLRAYITRERPPSRLEEVFLASKHEPLKYSGLRYIIKRLAQRAGVPDKGAHALRRGFAVGFLRGGGSVFHLQEILGHATLEMSRRYARLTLDDIKAAHEKASPVARALK